MSAGIRNYEITVITRPDLGQDEAAGEIKKILEEHQAQITGETAFGRRALNYERKHHQAGQYFLFKFQMNPDQANPLQKELNLKTNILQYMLKNPVR